MGKDGLVTMNCVKIAGLSSLVVIMVMAQLCVAVTQFNVGGSSGWELNGSNYQTWADGNTYHVGDVLVFSYAGGTHSVVETDAAGFQACGSSNAILQDSSGNTAVPLQTAGKHYFICGAPGHCPRGMKFSITVLPSTSSSNTGNSNPTPPFIPSNIDINSATALLFYHAAFTAEILIAISSISLLL